MSLYQYKYQKYKSLYQQLNTIGGSGVREPPTTPTGRPVSGSPPSELLAPDQEDINQTIATAKENLIAFQHGNPLNERQERQIARMSLSDLIAYTLALNTDWDNIAVDPPSSSDAMEENYDHNKEGLTSDQVLARERTYSEGLRPGWSWEYIHHGPCIIAYRDSKGKFYPKKPGQR